MAKKRALKQSGNRMDLKQRIFIYDYLSLIAIKIQRLFRGYMIRVFNYYQGPALFNRNLSLNRQDFLTMDDVSMIKYGSLFSFKENNFIYCFDVQSFNELIQSKCILNPYNRNSISYSIIQNFINLIKLRENLKYKTEKIMTPIFTKKKRIEFMIIHLIHLLNEFVYIEPQVLLKINNKKRINHFLNEIYGLWCENPNIELKRIIYPPDGNIFDELNPESFYKIKNNETYQKKFVEFLHKLYELFKKHGHEDIISFYIYICLNHNNI